MTDSDRAFTGPIPELYERYLGPMLFEPYACDMARRFAGFDGALLEIAAGTGRVTRALAEAVAPSAGIVATDLNEAMIARAADLVVASNVRWQQADAQALPFADATFDAVACQFGVMFFPDKSGAYAEVRRVLKPGGRYVFSVWDSLTHNDLSRVAQAAMGALFPDDPPDFMARVPFGYHDDAVIRGALADAGFGAVAVERVALKTPAASAADAATGFCLGTPMRAEIEARTPGQLAGAVETVTEALTAAFGPRAINGASQALVVTADT